MLSASQRGESADFLRIADGGCVLTLEFLIYVLRCSHWLLCDSFEHIKNIMD